MRPVGAGFVPLLHHDDRIVQELGRNPARDRLDRVALLHRELDEARRPPVELGANHSIAAAAERPDHGREFVATSTHHPSPDLVVDDRVSARDVLDRLRRVVADAFAERKDVDHPNAVESCGRRLDVAGDGKIEHHEGPTGAAGRRPYQVAASDHVAGRAGRRDDQVGVLQRIGQRVQPAVVCVRPLREGPRMLERAVEDPDRAHAATAEVMDGELGHPSGADHDRPPSGDPTQRLVRQVRADRDVRVRRGAEARLLPYPAAGAHGRVEHGIEHRTGRALGFGPAERLTHLPLDLRLTEDHRIQTRGHREQVVGGVALPVRVQRIGQLLVFDAPRLDEDALECDEPGVVAPDVAVGLDAVARRKDHHLVEPIEVLRVEIRLRQVGVVEGQPLEQLDGRTAERDTEAEDPHGRYGSGPCRTGVPATWASPSVAASRDGRTRSPTLRAFAWATGP